MRPFKAISEGFRCRSDFSENTLGRRHVRENQVFGAPDRCVAATSNSRTSSQEDKVLRSFKGISEGFRRGSDFSEITPGMPRVAGNHSRASERCVTAMFNVASRLGPGGAAALRNFIEHCLWDMDQIYKFV